MATFYDIRMRIFYTYAETSGLGRHIVRVEPLDLPGRQRVIMRHLSVTPRPPERREGLDFFGNRMLEIGFEARPAREIEFRLQARVERTSQRMGLDISPDLHRVESDLAAQRSLSGSSPHHFTGPSPRVSPTPAITAWAREIVTDDMTVREAVFAVGQALHDTMTFLPGVTDADTPAEEAFERREGVCQDYAHIMIAALRGLGVPAGYVSGFLRTLPPEGEEKLEGADAMHAWVRAWCGREMGWVEYDPTNAMTAGEDHIIVAYGRDYADVSPVKGVMRVAGSRGTGHAVDVVELSGA